MLAGMVAGVLASGFAWFVGEPAVSTAISFEYQRAAAAGMPYGAALVSRDIQSTLGLLTAIVVYGGALGGLFSLVFAAVYGRVREARPAPTAIWLAVGAFLVVYLVPFLKYPANPPSGGRPETIGMRSSVYVAMLACSLAGAIYTVWLSRRLEPRLGSRNAVLASIAVYMTIVVVAGLLLPGVNEVPPGFPAVTLWNFRVASLGIQAITWMATGLLFGLLAERTMDGPGARPSRAVRTTPPMAGS
jgi:hypothetical protein